MSTLTHLATAAACIAGTGMAAAGAVAATINRPGPQTTPVQAEETPQPTAEQLLAALPPQPTVEPSSGGRHRAERLTRVTQPLDTREVRAAAARRSPWLTPRTRRPYVAGVEDGAA